jgi:hypothetical protein
MRNCSFNIPVCAGGITFLGIFSPLFVCIISLQYSQVQLTILLFATGGLGKGFKSVVVVIINVVCCVIAFRLLSVFLTGPFGYCLALGLRRSLGFCLVFFVFKRPNNISYRCFIQVCQLFFFNYNSTTLQTVEA